MGQIGRLAGFVLVALAMIAVGVWSAPAHAHAGHGAAVAHPVSQSLPASVEIAAVAPSRDDRIDADCLIDCCPGGTTCVAHVAGPPGSAPELPDPGSVRLGPTPGSDLSGIVGELPPRPPRAA
jgi:hypothetical protein